MPLCGDLLVLVPPALAWPCLPLWHAVFCAVLPRVRVPVTRPLTPAAATSVSIVIPLSAPYPCMGPGSGSGYWLFGV